MINRYFKNRQPIHIISQWNIGYLDFICHFDGVNSLGVNVAHIAYIERLLL